MIKVGPLGNCTSALSNKPWEDIGKELAGVLCGIYIFYDCNGVVSIQSAYMQGTTVVVSEKHGGTTGNHFHSIHLDYPSERITSITGYYDRCGYLKSITFGTNQRTYGPFGSNKSSYYNSFSMTFGFGEFMGFHGNANDSYITAIGVYLKPYVGSSTSTAAGLIKSEPVG